ncbi:hypothetical protein [Enterococcus sp. DIV0098]|uniref:hypothetical protein n=1 Tax=Enterococcus sp. DIV0098 TaxID=2774843 RepID=UPI003F225810
MTENTTVNQINSVVTEMKMVVLGDGSTIPVPRLTNKKVLQLVKFGFESISWTYFSRDC